MIGTGRTTGRPRPVSDGMRKVRAPHGRTLGNAQASREESRGDGKCNRKHTADGPATGSGKVEKVR